MHVVTGGAYHGKSSWVKNFYRLDDESAWISAYRHHPCPYTIDMISEVVILEGIEEWIRQTTVKDKSFDRNDGQRVINSWLAWELEDKNRQLIVIGTDISKGIVPMDREDRWWRDMVGWFFQDLVLHCERFDVVWYGIPMQLK